MISVAYRGCRASVAPVHNIVSFRRVFAGLVVLGCAVLASVPARALTVTATTLPGLSYHYTTMWGSLNYLNTGFPNTQFACRNSVTGQRCSINAGTTGSIGQFDTSLGTLTQVDLAISIAHTYQVVVGDFGFPATTGSVTANDVGLGTRVAISQVTNAALGLNRFVNNLPEGAASSFVRFNTPRFGPGLRAESFSLQYTNAVDLALFEGIGTVDFDFFSTGFQTVDNANDLTLRGVSISPNTPGWRVSEHTRTFFPVITATYTYEELVDPGPGPVAGIPEPGSMALFLGGMTGLGMVARRRRKRDE
jgi:hypothetical protein